MGVLCFACLTSRGSNSFYSRFPFPWCLYSEPPWKMELVTPLVQRAGLFAVPCSKDNISLRVKIWYGPLGKNEGLISSEFLSCDANTASSHSTSPRGMWKQQDPEGCSLSLGRQAPSSLTQEAPVFRQHPRDTVLTVHLLALAGRVNPQALRHSWLNFGKKRTVI